MEVRNRVFICSLLFITVFGFADESKNQRFQAPSSKKQATQKQSSKEQSPQIQPPQKQSSQKQASDQQPEEVLGPYNQQAGDVGGEDIEQQTDVEKRQQADNSAWENTMGAPGSIGVSDSRGGFSPSQSP